MAQLLLLSGAGLPQESLCAVWLGKAAVELAMFSSLNSESSNSVTELGEKINKNFGLSEIELFTSWFFFLQFRNIQSQHLFCFGVVF